MPSRALGPLRAWASFTGRFGKPAPMGSLTAVKIDNHGHIPAHFGGSSKFTSTTAGGSSGKSGGTSGQGYKVTSTGSKGTGITHDFGSEKLDGKAHATAGTGSTGKFTSTSGETFGKTSSNGTQNKTLHSEDLRGASGLTSHDSKTMSYTTSGNGSKHTSGSGSSSGGSGNYRNQSGSSSSKDHDNQSGSGSGYSH